MIWRSFLKILRLLIFHGIFDDDIYFGLCLWNRWLHILKTDSFEFFVLIEIQFHEKKFLIFYLKFFRGLWDHIVPEEDPIETERKIESYTCQVCNKVCKNNLEKLEFPGRSTALCHLATDHGRLLKAMIEDTEVNMFEEIQKLAEWDKKFNETYKNFIGK